LPFFHYNNFVTDFPNLVGPSEFFKRIPGGKYNPRPAASPRMVDSVLMAVWGRRISNLREV
jgi:hypothetical protein